MDEVERAHFLDFLHGGKPGWEWMKPWFDVIGPRLNDGRIMRRVRVADDPPSDYVKFEMYMTPVNVRHGEAIRYLERSAAGRLGLPTYDYWLFDARSVVVMVFDGDDQLTGVEVDEEPAVVQQHLRWGEAAWGCSWPVGEYAGGAG
nr:DUF6879 family protein [Cryptosporangium arvum]